MWDCQEGVECSNFEETSPLLRHSSCALGDAVLFHCLLCAEDPTARKLAPVLFLLKLPRELKAKASGDLGLLK